MKKNIFNKKDSENQPEEEGLSKETVSIINSLLDSDSDEDWDDEDEDDEDWDDDFDKWEKVGSTAYYPSRKRELVDTIDSGYYKIIFDQNANSFFLSKKSIITDELIDLPIKNGNEIIDDIKKFWKLKEKYEKYNLLHKRGILMYGPPGSGKTSIINQIVKILIEEHKGIVFSIENTDDLQNFSDFSDLFRQIEPDRPIVVIIEDIDGLLDGGRNIEKILLNVLDGINQIDNVAYISTTNYPERMEARLINRPGRFDRRFKIGFPNAMARKVFFESKFLDEDIEKYNIKDMVEKTKGLTISHCKEVFTEYVIKERELDEVVSEMHSMNNQTISSDNNFKNKKVGFNGKDNDEDDGFDMIEWINVSTRARKKRKN